MKKIIPYSLLSLDPRANSVCVSIYANNITDLVRSLDQVEELALKDLSAKEVDILCRPIHRFLKSDTFINCGFPLALFSSLNFSGYAKLPFEPKSMAVVARSFHVKPLIKWMQRELPFTLLRLDDTEAVLMQGSLSQLVELERLPYQGLRAMDGVFNALDRAVYRSIQSTRTPLVLAGEADLIEHYKNISGYKAIVEDSIISMHALRSDANLHAEAIRILTPFMIQRETQLLSQFYYAERAGRASSYLADVIAFALQKKVKHLFIHEKMHIWGEINRETGEFTYQAEQQNSRDDDILDDLAEIVLRNGGQVTVLSPEKMPKGKAACAILSPSVSEIRMQTAADSYGRMTTAAS